MANEKKNYCRSCRRKTSHIVLFTKTIGSEPNDDFMWSEDYQIVECAGCSSVCFRKVSSDETMYNYDDEGNQFSYHDVSIYPPVLEDYDLLTHTYCLPHKIKVIYDEAIEAFKSKCYLLTAVAFRTVIEAICIENDIKGNNLEMKIKNLSKNKLITEREEKRLHSIRFLGNDSVHEISVPKPSILRIVLEILDHLLRNLYIIDEVSMSELETVIDTYESFLKLLYLKTKNVNEFQEKTIREILGKDTRRIGERLIEFEKTLAENISNGAVKFLSLGKVVGNKPVVQYYIIVLSQHDQK